MAKTAAELMAEAEELQRKVAPELYGDAGNNDGTSDDKTVIPGETAHEDDDKTPEEIEAEAEAEKARLESEEAANQANNQIDPRDAEIARLKDELMKLKVVAGRVNQAGEANDRLRERLALLEQEMLSIKASKKEPEKPEVDEERNELISEYGDNSPVVKMYDKQKAREERLLNEINSVRSEIGSVKDTSSRSAAEKFTDTLLSEVNDYETVRDMPEFATYLKDNMLMPALREAASNLDATTTARIYKGFKATLSTHAQKPNEQPPAKKDKARLIAPGSSGKADSSKDTPVYTLAEVEQMTKEMSSLRRKGRVKEADKIKAKIDAFTESLGAFA